MRATNTRRWGAKSQKGPGGAGKGPLGAERAVWGQILALRGDKCTLSTTTFHSRWEFGPFPPPGCSAAFHPVPQNRPFEGRVTPGGGGGNTAGRGGFWGGKRRFWGRNGRFKGTGSGAFSAPRGRGGNGRHFVPRGEGGGGARPHFGAGNARFGAGNARFGAPGTRISISGPRCPLRARSGRPFGAFWGEIAPIRGRLCLRAEGGGAFKRGRAAI